MAPSTEAVTLIYVWPHFQAVKDGQPLMAGRLWTFQAETSTPKAAFLDPFFVTPHAQPIILNDQGAAEIWLNGYYHLRLEDEEGVLIWDVPSFTFATGAPPMPPGSLIEGSTDGTVSASPGAAVLALPGLVPLGYRVRGLTWTITSSFGTSGGLTGLMLGDRVAADRWMQTATPTAGQTGGQLHFHAGEEPVAAPDPYVVLVAALGGLFDAQGDLHVTVYWASLPADVVP